MVGCRDFDIFSQLIKRANVNSRTLGTIHDELLNEHLFSASGDEKWMPNKLPEEVCFAFIDETDPKKLDGILNDLLPRMSYGSTLFFKEFDHKTVKPYQGIIRRLLTRRKNEVVTARQMMVDGYREISLAVKYFPTNKMVKPDPYNGEINVATVLKLGGDYDATYVNALANGIAKNLTRPYQFVCLTDCSEGFNSNVHKIVPLEHGFEKWWSKIELFAPDRFENERVFYLDLDTIITSNINDIAMYSGRFFGLRDFFNQMGLGSGLMAWANGDPVVGQIYEKFMESPEAHMRGHRMGDQEFINNTLGNYIEYAQDLYPNKIYSYKKDCLGPHQSINIPDTASIVCFHGKPRPHQVKDPKITQYFQP
jgi:hypothetical protein